MHARFKGDVVLARAEIELFDQQLVNEMDHDRWTAGDGDMVDRARGYLRE